MFTINQNLIDDFADKINEKEKKNNKVTSWSSTTTDTHYPSEKLVKDSLDGKASLNDLISGLQQIGASTIHTVYHVSGSTSAYDISLGLSYTQTSSVFFLVKNDIGDNEANATLKYYPNGNNITIIDGFSNTSYSPIQQGVWKKNTWALFYCYGNSTVQLKCIFYDEVEIDKINNILGIENLSYYVVSSVSKDSKRVTLKVNDDRIYNGNSFYLKVPYYETSTNVSVSIQHSSNRVYQNSNIVTESQVNGHLLKLRWNNNIAGFDVLYIYEENKLVPYFSDLSSVAISGSYNDLSDKPTIPSKTSDLTNDSGFLTSHQSLDSKTVTVEEQAQAETGFTKTYIIKQGGVQVGNKINIPKDFLVKSASVKTVSTANNPVQGYVAGDKYLDFVVNSKDNTATDEHLYVLVSELVDTEIDWANVQNKPTFFDGNYNSLTNKPSIPNASSDLSDGSDLVKKSSTTGLLKNDGSVMSSGTGSSNWAVGNHTHTSLQKTTITSGSLDDYTDTGWYSYSTTNSSSITNTPENVGSVMEVLDDYGDGQYIVQKVYPIKSDKYPLIYIRIKYASDGWGDWERIIDTGDASTTAPVANRVASSATTGSSTKYARADHSHTLTQFKCNGTAGSNGYIKVFQIKINSTYQDSPISFSLMQRGTKQSAVVNIRFANENNNDPTLDSFTFSGGNIGNNGEYYLYKESASTWSFIVRKWDTHDVINIYNMSTTNGSVAITSLNTQISELPSGCIPASMVKNDLFFKTKNGSTSNYINLFEIRPTGDYQAKPITFEIVRQTKPTPIYVSVRLTNVTLASNTYAPQTIYAWGTSDTPVYIRKEANNVFNVIMMHTANEEISVCNMNNPNQSVKLTPLGTVYGTDAPATSGDNQVWTHTYTVGGTTFGTGTNNVVRGNDSRLSDARNPKSTKISAGSDLNTYTTTGFYYNNANTDCATITPLPQPNKAFFLQVEDWGTSNYTKQTITHYDPVKTYERIRNAGTWTDWYELQHNDGTGGENLLRTEPNNEGTSGIAYTIADETFHNDKVYYRNETSKDTTKYSGWTWAIPRNEFDYEDVFTLSFYAKGTNGAEIRTYFAGPSGYISNRRISSNSDIDNNISSYGDGATRFHLTSDWKRYYVTYRLNSTATTPTQNKSIHIRTFGASTDIELYISNVKLERGYYATDYDRHTKDNEPLYFPTEVSMPTTTTSTSRRKFIHPPYKFKNIPNWTVEGEIKVTGNSARFELHKTDDTNLKNFIAVGKNASGNLAYWWGTSSSAESSKTYDASHIAVDTWYPFRISRMGNNVLFMFNNTDKYEVTTTYFNTFEYIEPSIFGYGTNGASVRNLKITPLEPVYPLSPSSSVCTNAQGIITTEAKNNHTHSDTQLNWNGGAMVNSASPLDMCLNEELSPNRLAYLDGNNIDVDYSTDGGSTWTSYGASATEKSKLVTTTQTFISGKGATASSNNQLRITIHSGLTSGNASQVYLATRKLMIYYSTGGGSGNKVKIQTNTYGSPDTWTNVKEYNIGGYSGWNSFPLNITFGGFANQTNTTRIKSIRLIFTITSNHNFNVQKIRLYGENCYTAQSDYAKTGHIYSVDILKNATFPAKIIKSDGTSSQFLMANGDVQNKVTSWSDTPSDSNIASEKLVKDSLDQLGVIDLTSYTNNVSDYDANGISLSVTENNELYVTGSDGSNKPYHTKTFTNNDIYTIQFDIKQTSGAAVGKRFCILIGDPSNVLEISFKDYFTYIYIDGDIIGQFSAIQISDYKTIRIHRNLNNWIFDYNNGEKTQTFRTSNDIPNKISYYGFGSDEELYVKNVKLYANSIVNNINNIVDMIYPIGSIYMSVNSTSPQILFGGTWEQIQDKFLLASGSTYSNGATGGSATVSLSASQMPRHNHSTNAHSHTTNTTGEYFVTNTQSTANNTRVAYSSSGNRMVDGFDTTSSIFHHRSDTSNASPTTRYTGGTGSTEAYQNGSAHENMPPYLVVNVWKRTA